VRNRNSKDRFITVFKAVTVLISLWFAARFGVPLELPVDLNDIQL
jgi:hypothetical protein